MHFTGLRAALGQAALLCAAVGLFVSVSSSVAQELPSAEPLDAKSLAKRIRKSIVVLTQIGRDDEEAALGGMDRLGHVAALQRELAGGQLAAAAAWRRP